MSENTRARRLERLFRSLADGSSPPAIMGILNVTPDSFSDGGQLAGADEAVDHARRMIDDGADVIDVGPESTRPGSAPVSTDEQLRRAIPVIDALRQAAPDVPISIDTRDARVAKAALDAGADLVNDVSALRDDPAMADMAADAGAGVVLMHMRGTPKTMQSAGGGPTYKDVVAEVREFLSQRVDYAVGCGVQRDRIIIDPGIGFGKTVEHNVLLLRNLPALAEQGVPVLVGASRKSFIGQITGVARPADRLPGSLVFAALAGLAGAVMVRVHDVAETRQAVTVAQAIRPGTEFTNS